MNKKHGLKKILKDGMYLHALIQKFNYTKNYKIQGTLIILKRDLNWIDKIDKAKHPKDEDGNYQEVYAVETYIPYEILITDTSNFSSDYLSGKDTNMLKEQYLHLKTTALFSEWDDFVEEV